MIFLRYRHAQKARPTHSTYLPQRQEWIERTVRKTAAPNGNASWIIHVRQLAPEKQQIQLELLGDGIIGLIYEATADSIVPLRARLVGPGGAFVILAVYLLLWCGSWLLIWLFRRQLKSRGMTAAR